ncbi:MAG: class A beta-lactamase [Proteobacteria bacterium]|nr:class A beta-lactamase [Pseudomonadota bacterium]
MNRDPSRSTGLTLSRRGVVLTSLAFAGAAAVRAPARAAPTANDAAAQLTALEHAHGGRLGLFALDTGSGRALEHRADDRFLMCSTMKAALAGATLARIDKGVERLDRRVPYRKADMLANAPVTKAHLHEGGMSVEALCAAAVQESDNTAAVLLLRQLGGTAPLTRFVRSLGDTTSRFDRPEPFLNREKGVLDTTTPRGTAAGLKTLLLGAALSPASRTRLWTWMETSTPGKHRLRAGLPADWRIAHKTGTSGQGQANDISVIRPSRGAPLIVTAYYVAPAQSDDGRDAVIAEAARIVSRWRG